jgi:flagellin
MTSINTNRSAMTALQSLNSTNDKLEQTQQRISTGYRVSNAVDNAAYWSIATTMRSDNAAISTVKDALGLGAAMIDIAYNGMNSAIETVKEIKNKLVAARQPGVDRGKIQSEIEQLQSQLRSTALSSVFSGENWLASDSSDPGYNQVKSVVASFSRNATGISVQTIDFNIANSELYDDADKSGILDKETTTTVGGAAFSVATLNIGTLNTSAGDTADLEQMINWVDSSLEKMTSSAADLGAVKKRVDSQSNFVKSLMDAITRGISSLVEADMTEESTKLQALQVQQQLGIQSLSIANQSSQSILSLFKG